jgi:hypothetical protein
MSDMSNLSNEYAASADFAAEVNAAALALKRAWSQGEETASGQSPDEAEPRKRLAQVLFALARALSPAEPTGEAEAPLVIPEDVISRLEAKHRAQLAWFLDDLRQTAAALEDKTPLEAEKLQMLDEVCDAADATASASFRRLWRR